MGISLSAKGAKSESDVANGQKPLKGRYLAMVKAVDETMEKKDQVNVDFEILAGTTPDQRGRILTEYFTVSEKALPRLTRLALCTGILKPEETADVSFMAAIGRVLFIEVEDHTYENKEKIKVETVRVSFGGMWSVGNPDVQDLLAVPEVAQMMHVLRGGHPKSTEVQVPATAPSTPGSAATAQPVGDKGKWGALL